jgi:hypothetical protein
MSLITKLKNGFHEQNLIYKFYKKTKFIKLYLNFNQEDT